MPHSPAEIALIKNALASERPPERVSPLSARRTSRTMPLPEVSAEVRAEYAYTLTELAGRYMDADEHLSTVEADRHAAADLGCVEFWDYVANERWREPRHVAGRVEHVGEFEPGDVSRQLDLWVRLSLAGAVPAVGTSPARGVEHVAGIPDPSVRCPQCESIGHGHTDAAPCPLTIRIQTCGDCGREWLAGVTLRSACPKCKAGAARLRLGWRVFETAARVAELRRARRREQAA